MYVAWKAIGHMILAELHKPTSWHNLEPTGFMKVKTTFKVSVVFDLLVICHFGNKVVVFFFSSMMVGRARSHKNSAFQESMCLCRTHGNTRGVILENHVLWVRTGCPSYYFKAPHRHLCVEGNLQNVNYLDRSTETHFA